MHADKRRSLDKLTRTVIGAAFEVSNTLGSGFLEKVYERSLLYELRARGLLVEQQVSISVSYKGSKVGDYVADLVVEGTLIVELKCVATFADEHVAQCLNYLKASGQHVALL